METVYEQLICDLKTKLKNKGITSKEIKKYFKLINNGKHDEIIQSVNDETIHELIYKIIAERKRIGDEMERKLNDLVLLNKIIIIFGEEPQPTKTKALHLLKTKVFINIYDFAAGKYEKRTTKNELIKDLRKNPDRRFPLLFAKQKQNKTLKCFLTNIYNK